jgi:hypothetical protein
VVQLFVVAIGVDYYVVVATHTCYRILDDDITGDVQGDKQEAAEVKIKSPLSEMLSCMHSFIMTFPSRLTPHLTGDLCTDLLDFGIMYLYCSTVQLAKTMWYCTLYSTIHAPCHATPANYSREGTMSVRRARNFVDKQQCLYDRSGVGKLVRPRKRTENQLLCGV